jgi:hypothetical protein
LTVKVFSEVRNAAYRRWEEGVRLRGEETAGIEEAAKAAATWLAWQLSSAQQPFEGLPLWIQLLLVAIIVVALFQWQRRRRR